MVDYVKQDMKLLWAELGDYVAPTNEKITQGWLVEVPPRQYWNWLENRQDKQLAYLTQKGISEWDNTLEYIINKSYVQHNGVVYRCVRTNTGVTPGTSTLDWVVAFTTSTAASEALKAVTPAANMLPYFTSTTAASTTSLTAFARTILDDADAATVRTTISAQTLNANLTAISGLTSAANKLPYFTGSGTAATTDLSAFGRSLIDDADAAAARNTLGLGSLAVQSDGSISITGGTISGITDLAIEDGGTGASTAAGARTNLGLGTAAVANVTTSTTDTTAGRLLKVGDFGVGTSTPPGITDCNAATINGVYGVTNTTTNTPISATYGTLVVTGRASGNEVTQTCFVNASTSVRVFTRNRYSTTAGVWGEWVETFHTGNVSSSAQTLMSSGVLPDAGLSGNYTGVNISGNAGTATALQTARTINGVSFNGTANITVADATKLPLTGGTMTGATTHEAGAVQTASHRWTSGGVLRWQMGREADGNTFRLWHYNASGAFAGQFSFNGTTGVISAVGFSGSGANLTEIPATQLTGVVPDANLSGTYTGVSITGNAATATQLATARTINGVSFNGTANITIADSTKVPLAGGTMTGTLNAPTFNATSTTGGGFQGVDADTAAQPSFTWTADLDTGIYHPAADVIGFTAGGAERGRINTTGFSGNGSQLTALNAANISTGTLAVARGGTGVTTSTGSGSNVLSTSPALTGTPTAPTAADGTNTTQIATTAFVQNSITSQGLVPAGSAKAWVCFTGTGTVAIRGSYGVSSVIDNGVGDYTINFLNAMPSANYSAVATVQRADAYMNSSSIISQTTTAVRVDSLRESNGGRTTVDTATLNCVVFSY